MANVISDIFVDGTITATSFKGDATNITGLGTSVVTAFNNYGSGRVLTSGGTGIINCEPNLVWNGSSLNITGTVNAYGIIVGSAANISNPPPRPIAKANISEFRTYPSYNNAVFTGVTHSSSLKLYCAVGATTGAICCTSTDGINWTPQTIDSTGQAKVFWANSLFVSCMSGGQGKIFSSTDGITWTEKASSKSYRDVCFLPASSSWIFVGSASPYGIYTTDFSTYSNSDLSAGIWTSVCYSPVKALLMTVSQGNGIKSSPDGITWTTETGVTAAGFNWNSVCWGNDKYVAVGSLGSKRACYSLRNDSAGWTLADIGGNDDQWMSVTYANGYFVALGQSVAGDKIATSPDGINWTVHTAKTGTNSSTWVAGCYNSTNKHFVGVGGVNTDYYPRCIVNGPHLVEGAVSYDDTRKKHMVYDGTNMVDLY